MPHVDPLTEFTSSPSPAQETSIDKIRRIARSDNLPDEIADDFGRVTGLESGRSHYGRGGRVKVSPVDPKDGQQAIGFSQIKPSTAKSVGVDNPYDEESNIKAGLRYYAQGGDDPIRRRIAYFSGQNSGAVKHYDRTGQIPSGGDFTGTSFKQYIAGTGGTLQDTQDPLTTFTQAKPQSVQPSDPLTNFTQPETSQLAAPIEGTGRGAAMARASQAPPPQSLRGTRVRPMVAKGWSGTGTIGEGVSPPTPAFPSTSTGMGDVRMAEGREGQREQLVQKYRTELQKADAPMELGFVSGPDPRTFDKYAEEAARRADEDIATQRRLQSPEVVAGRKEMGAMPAWERTYGASALRVAGGLLKSAAGSNPALIGLEKITGHSLTDYLQKKGQTLEDVSTTPLNEQGEAITRSVPEKVGTALTDLGLSVVMIAAMQKATGLPMSQIMAIESALKSSDKSVKDRAVDVAQAYGMGKILDQHLSRPASAALFGAPTALQTGAAVARGDMTLSDALLETGVQMGAGAILGGKPEEAPKLGSSKPASIAPVIADARAERVRTATEGAQPLELPRTAPAEPLRITRPEESAPPLNRWQHRDFGLVTESADQSGAGKGRVRVLAEDGTEHIIQRPKGTGAGNQIAVPLREKSDAQLADEAAQAQEGQLKVTDRRSQSATAKAEQASQPASESVPTKANPFAASPEILKQVASPLVSEGAKGSDTQQQIQLVNTLKWNMGKAKELSAADAQTVIDRGITFDAWANAKSDARRAGYPVEQTSRVAIDLLSGKIASIPNAGSSADPYRVSPSQGEAKRTQPKTQIDLILDSAIKQGLGEVTIPIPEKNASREQVQKLVDHIESRGLSASTDGKHVLVRGFRELKPEGEAKVEPKTEPTADRRASRLQRNEEIRQVNKQKLAENELKVRRPLTTEIMSGVKPSEDVAESQIVQPETKPELKPPVEGERSFPKTLESTGRKGGTDRTYQVVRDQEAIDKADARIKENSEGARQWASDQLDKGSGKEAIATGLRVADNLSNEAAQESDPGKAAEKHAQASDLYSKLAARLTESGQEVQAASLAQKYSPSGAALEVQRIVEKVKGEKATPELQDVTTARDLAEKYQAADARISELEKQIAQLQSGKTVRPPRVSSITPLKARLDKAAEDAALRIAATKAKMQAGELEFRNAGPLPGHIATHLTDYAIIGAAKIAKGGLTFAEWSAEMVKDLGEDIKPHLATIFRASKKHLDEQRGIAKEESAQRGATKELTKRGVASTAENIESLRAEKSKLQAERRQARVDLDRHYRELERKEQGHKLDAVMSLTRDSLLSARGVIRIAIGMGGKQVLDFSSRFVKAGTDIARSTATGGPRTVSAPSFASTLRTIGGFVERAPSAIKSAVQGKPSEVMPNAHGGPTENPYVNLTVGVMQRTYAGKEAFVSSWAYPEALENNARVFALNDRADGLTKLGQTNQRTKDYLSGKLSFEGKRNRKLAQSLAKQAANYEVSTKQIVPSMKDFRAKELAESPTELLHSMALQATDRAVYRQPYESKLAQKLGQVGTDSVGGKIARNIVLPFSKRPANNIADNLFGYTGLRTFGEGYKAIRESINGEFGPARVKSFNDAIGKGATGFAVMAVGAALSKKGMLISPLDKDKSKAGSLFINGKYYNVSNVPVIGWLLGMGAAYQSDGAANLPKALYRMISEHPLLRSAKDISDMVEGLKSNKPGEQLSEYAGRQGARFIPAPVKIASEALDTEERQTKFSGKKADVQQNLIAPTEASLPILRRRLPSTGTKGRLSVINPLYTKPISRRPQGRVIQ